MKKTFLTLVSAISFQLAAFSAEPVVVVLSATRVTVDGREAGKPADTIANRPELASALQRALERFVSAEAAKLEAAEAKLAAAVAARAAVVARVKAEATTLSAAAQRELRGLLHGLDAPEREARAAALRAELAAKQAELDALK